MVTGHAQKADGLDGKYIRGKDGNWACPEKSRRLFLVNKNKDGNWACPEGRRPWW